MDALLGECGNHDRPFFFFGANPTPLRTHTHNTSACPTPTCPTRHPNHSQLPETAVMPWCHWDELRADKQHKGSVRSEPKYTPYGTTHTHTHAQLYNKLHILFIQDALCVRENMRSEERNKGWILTCWQAMNYKSSDCRQQTDQSSSLILFGVDAFIQHALPMSTCIFSRVVFSVN